MKQNQSMVRSETRLEYAVSGDFLTLVLEAASSALGPSLLPWLPYHRAGKVSMCELCPLTRTPPLQALGVPGVGRELPGLPVMGGAA